VDFGAPFRCLSVPRALAAFGLVLQEAKVLFISSRAELLTQVMEALRSLIFPLEWQSVYVPRLPRALSGCLECPGGFMIGMHLTQARHG
ncbi:DENN domain-containing protein, partial [Tribonema minus]